MSYYWETQLSTISSCKSLLRNLVKRAVKNSYPQKRLIEEYNTIFRNYCGGSPRWLRNELSGYFDGLKDALHEPATLFAYEYEGKLYSTHKDSVWPHYEKSGVPINKIHKLACGIYYKETGILYSGRREGN